MKIIDFEKKGKYTLGNSARWKVDSIEGKALLARARREEARRRIKADKKGLTAKGE